MKMLKILLNNYIRFRHIIGSVLFAAIFFPFSALAQFSTDFQKVELLTGLKNSVNMEFAPDGRIFILDRYGEIIIYKPETQTNVSAGTLDVFHDMEDGLLAIAFDPQFINNNYIYLHYSHPSLPKNRVSRFTMVGDVLDLSSEVVVLEWGSARNGYYHAAGDMDFDSQGNLFIAIGDNTDHSKYATLDESNKNKSSERTSSNTNDLRGKILRIKPHPDGSYSIPEGNLFPGGVGGLPEIYVMGARNPFKIFVDKSNTDWLFWGEVGPDASAESNLGPEGKDEINLTKAPGNYGWPYFSGKNIPYLNTYADPNFYYDPSQPVNLSQWNTGADNLPPAQPSWLDFFHQCYFAGPRYYFDPSIDNSKKLPSDFDKVFFYYDFNKSKIWGAKLDEAGNLLSVEPFLHNIITGAGFIDLKIGPDGQMYILEYGAGCCPDNTGTGKLLRLDFTGIDSNRTPNVNISADNTSGALPLTVNFSSQGTLDPDGDELLYEWDFQSDGIIDSNEENPTFTYTQKGTYKAQLRVDDSKGGIGSKTLTIGAGNNAATFQFVYPPNGGMIDWWDNIDYEIVINDIEDGSTSDGTIDCSQLNLIPSFGHLTHSHDGLTINNCQGTFFLDPSSHDTEGFDDIYYVFKVNYTDADGLTSFDQITVHPKLTEAEFYDLQSNTQLIDNSDNLGGGKNVVRALTHGSYIMLEKRNLLNINLINYRVASNLGGNIEVRVGSPSGTLISTVAVPNTGGLNQWVNIETPVTDPGGSNDLYFVFTDSQGTTNLFDINNIEFKGQGVSSDETPPAISLIKVLSPYKVSVKFNEPVQKSPAEQVSNYLINNGVSISSATLQADRRTVILNTSEITLQVENELTVSNLVNEAGIMLYQSIKETFTFKGELLRINAGGPTLDISGTKWEENKYNSGGYNFSNTSLSIGNTTSDPIYQSEINGDFIYNIPVPSAGIYDVSLHFAELYHQRVGARVFNVDIEQGQFSLNNYDIFSNVGYAAADIRRFFGINVEDGFLTLKFTSIQNKAKISAIEILYGKETVQQPSIEILDPKHNATVIQPFSVHFQVSKWEVGEGTTHIHKFLDGVDLGEVYSTDSINFNDLPLGPHEIQLVLANADHSLTEYQDKIQVKVVDESSCTEMPFPLIWGEKIIGSEVPYRSVYIFAEDIDADGFKDLVAGAWWYKNPGSRNGTWLRKVIGAPMNNMSVIHDFDQDGDKDIFGTQGTYIGAKMAWAENDGNGNFIVHTNIPDGTSSFGETFMAGAAIGNFDGVENTQIAIVWNGAESSNSPVQMLTVPADPVNQPWTITSISQDSYGEDISAGDIDDDGDLDLFQAGNWLRNDNGTWTAFSTWLTMATHFDRNALADLDQDGDLDGVVTQIGNGQDIAWFKPQDDPTKPWIKEIIGNEVDGGLSLNLVDIDGDGDLDVLTGEWKGSHRLLAFENDLCNSGTWIKQVLHSGGEMDHHDSAITADLDNDGALDIFSIGWDKRVPRIYWNNVNSEENFAPIILNPIPDQKATAGVSYSYTFPENTFSDPEGEQLAYSAALASGEELPNWLSFDSLTRTFSGTPLTNDIGSTEITVTASDSTNGAMDSFIFAVELEGTTKVRINSGGGELNAYGNVFSGDNAFSGGTTYTNTKVTGISGTSEQELYKTERFGAFSYNIGVPDGTYVVRLHFAELYFGAPEGGTGEVGRRVFNVTGEGQPLLTNFDIYEEVGAMAALVKEFEIPVSDGSLDLAFTKLVDNPKISAIEIVTKSAYTVGQIVASQDTVQFFQQQVESTVSKSITLTNEGDVALEINSLSVTGEHAGDFGYNFISPFILGPDASTDVPLNFQPSTVGDKSAQLNIWHTGLNSPLVVELSGEGIHGPDNNVPQLDIPIPDQSASPGTEFNFTFPENTFSDSDGDVLAYSAILSESSSLPEWLIFDNINRTFSGTPTVADTLTLSIVVTAHDGKNGTVSDGFNIYFESANLSPEVSESIPDQEATVGSLFNFTFGENTFHDPEGDSLMFSSSLANGHPLPSWLNFEGGIRTFGGVPPDSSAGTYDIMITASDGNKDVSELFVLFVSEVNNTAIRINAGGSEVEANGNVFSGDTMFYGGSTFTNSKIAAINGTSDAALYVGERNGAFSYKLPVPSGIYIVRLHFAEIWFGATGGATGSAGQRVFNVTGENQPLLTNFDIYAEVGPMTALIKEFEVSVNDGNLNLSFLKVVDNPKISAIEVISKSNSTNFMPVSNAGPDQTVMADANGVASVILDGAASSDKDGTIVSYSWKEGENEIATGVNPTVILSPGSHLIGLTVTDNDGKTGTDFVTVTVNTDAPANQAPVVNAPIPDQHATKGVSYSFTFSQSSFSDPEGENLTYSASLSDESTLPNWLSFNENTRTFSGTPDGTSTDNIEIKLTASDGELEVIDLFNLTVADPSSISLRINAGGEEISAYGGVFSADQLYSGGYSFKKTMEISGTVEDELYNSERYGSFSYNMPVPQGTYIVKLHFAEIYFGATGGGEGDVGKRIFNVMGEGQALLTNYDIFAKAGAMTAIIEEFELTVTDGFLNLFFAKVVNNPKVSAVEVISKTESSNQLPIANAGTDQTVSAEADGWADIVLNGSGSADPDGVISSYDWSEGGTSLATGETPTISLPVGNHTILHTVTDSQGATATDEVIITVMEYASLNENPTVSNTIPDQVTVAGSLYQFTFEENTFEDSDGDSLSYSAVLSDRSLLPTWLNFEGSTRTFSGTPNETEIGQLEIQLSAQDSHGGSVADNFILTVESGEATNHSPIVLEPISDQTFNYGESFGYTFPQSTFADPEGDSLSYLATLSDGGALPTWLSFEANTRTFTGTSDADLGSIEIKVTATDGELSASDFFNITVEEVVPTFIRINSGGQEITAFGETFAVDQKFFGGYTFNKSVEIAETTADELYTSERYGSFNYKFPLPSGNYIVRLHFAEIYFGATGGGEGAVGKRIFNVKAEGQPLLTNFDIFEEVGAMTALVKEFELAVTDGILNITFEKVLDNPKVSAIEIISVAGSTALATENQRRTTEENGLTPVVAIKRSPSEQFGQSKEGGLIKIYPNPFEDLVKIKFGVENPQDYKITIYDVAGKVYYQGIFTSNQDEKLEYTLNLGNKSLTAGGIYLFYIESNNGRHLEIFKMMKR